MFRKQQLNLKFNLRTPFNFYFSIIFAIHFYVIYVNFSDTYLIAGEDYGLNYLFPEFWYNLSSNTWDDQTGLGKPSITSSTTYIWSTFMVAGNNLGISPWLMPRIIYSFLYFFTNLTTFFYFSNHISSFYKYSKKTWVNNSSSFLGSTVFTFSFFIASMTHHPIYSYHLFIPIFPILLFILEKNFVIGVVPKAIVYCSICLLILANGNVAQTLIIIMFVLIHMFYFSKHMNQKLFKRYLIYLISIFTLSVILASHILLPFVYSFLLTNNSNPFGDVGNIYDSLNFNSRRASFLNIITGEAYPWFDSFDYYQNYNKNLFPKIAGLFIFLFSLYCLLDKRARNQKIYWLTVVIISIFLVKGSQPPFSDFWIMLFDINPMFGMFRAVYHKFGIFIYFGLAALTTFSFVEILALSWKPKIKICFSIFLISLIIINRYPIFTGDIVNQEYKLNLPNDYYKLRDLFKKLGNSSRVLALPATPKGSGSLHSWPNNQQFVGPHILTYMNVNFIDAAYFIKNGYFNTEPKDWWSGIKLEQQLNDVIYAAEEFGANLVYIQLDGFDEYTFNNITYILNTKLKSEIASNYMSTREDYKLITNSKFYELYKKNNFKNSKLDLVTNMNVEW